MSHLLSLDGQPQPATSATALSLQFTAASDGDRSTDGSHLIVCHSPGSRHGRGVVPVGRFCFEEVLAMVDRPPSRWFYVLGGGAAVAVFGLCVAVSLVVGSVGFLTRVGSLPRAVMPGSVQMELPAGNYTAYYEARTVFEGRAYQAGPSEDLSCGLTGPSGTSIELRSSAARFTYNVGSYSGESVFVFRAPQDGRYTLACDSSQQSRRPAVIAIGRGRQWSAAALLAGGIAGLVVGLGICAVVYARRRRWARIQPYSANAVSAPGGGPSPFGIHAAYPPDTPGQPVSASPHAPPGPAPPDPALATPSPPSDPGPGPVQPGSRPLGPPVPANVSPAPQTAPPPPWPAVAGSPQAGSDPLAVAALVFGILGIIVVAVPLAVVSLSRTRPGSRRGLAAAALAVSAGWALVAAVAVIALIPSLGPGRVLAASTPSPSANASSPAATASSPPASPSTEVGFAELRVGDCVESQPEPSSGSLTRVSCTVPHELELIAIRELGSGRWPGRQVVDTRGDRLCTAAFQSYIGIPFDRSEFDLISYLPDEEGWRQGDHTVHCFAAHPGPKKTGTVRGSHR